MDGGILKGEEKINHYSMNVNVKKDKWGSETDRSIGEKGEGKVGKVGVVFW